MAKGKHLVHWVASLRDEAEKGLSACVDRREEISVIRYFRARWQELGGCWLGQPLVWVALTSSATRYLILFSLYKTCEITEKHGSEKMFFHLFETQKIISLGL